MHRHYMRVSTCWQTYGCAASHKYAYITRMFIDLRVVAYLYVHTNTEVGHTGPEVD